MLIDTHLHAAPLSMCAHISGRDLADIYMRAGYGAVVLTNHYSKYYMEAYRLTYETWLELYLNEWRSMAEYGKHIGLKVLLGAEVTLNRPYADYLLFGVDESFFYRNPRLFELDQRALYALCEQEDVLLIQAHPFRTEQGHELQDPKYLHGLEMNGHPFFSPEQKRVLQTAKKHNLIVTTGGDVHDAAAAARVGIEVPDSISTAKQLAQYLKRERVPIYKL